jgi:hypothetical protein
VATIPVPAVITVPTTAVVTVAATAEEGTVVVAVAIE